MSYQFRSCAPTDDLASQNDSWYNLVSERMRCCAELEACQEQIKMLTQSTEEAMAGVYRAAYVTLHVRKSNRAALSLYKDTLEYRIHETEKGYCGSVLPEISGY